MTSLRTRIPMVVQHGTAALVEITALAILQAVVAVPRLSLLTTSGAASSVNGGAIMSHVGGSTA